VKTNVDPKVIEEAVVGIAKSSYTAYELVSW
jgi:hypothetical protein